MLFNLFSGKMFLINGTPWFLLLVGPFVVMLGKMIGDLLKFCFLYLEFYIPYGKTVCQCSTFIMVGSHQLAGLWPSGLWNEAFLCHRLISQKLHDCRKVIRFVHRKFVFLKNWYRIFSWGLQASFALRCLQRQLDYGWGLPSAPNWSVISE